jgi:hypothetical protein
MISAKQLRKDSWDFVFDHLDSLWKQLKYVAPIILVFAFLDTTAQHYEFPAFQIVTALASIYFWGCFALSWHRFSLMGPSEDRAIDPFGVTSKDWDFIKVFIVLSLVPVLLIVFIGLGFGGLASVFRDNAALIVLFILGGIVALCAMLWFFLRVGFLLPAQSMNVTISLEETKVIAKGLRLKILWGSFIYTLIGGLVIILYAMVAGLVTMVILGMMGVSGDDVPFSAVIVGYVISLPIYAVIFIVAALNISLLSRAYQWGMQNNR